MKPTFNQRLRYQFDNLMARGTPVNFYTVTEAARRRAESAPD